MIKPNSDFVVVIRNLKVEYHDLKFSLQVEGKTVEIHTTFKTLKEEQNTIKNKNSIFVNIIHSIDALHIAIIVKTLNIDSLPIHDALLLPIKRNLSEVKEVIEIRFINIHRNNITFKEILICLSKKLDKPELLTLAKDIVLEI
jgi:hypothetical protein